MADGSRAEESFDAEGIFATSPGPLQKGPAFRLHLPRREKPRRRRPVGRDNNSQYFTGEIFYNRQWGSVATSTSGAIWTARPPASTRIQNRHEVRANVAKPLLDNRVRLNFSTSWPGSTAQPTRAGTGIVEIVPARQGLFVVDTTPEIGELDPAPDLINGDFETPAAPGIEIGGANTFRNIGLDLGLTTQVTRLEITRGHHLRPERDLAGLPQPGQPGLDRGSAARSPYSTRSSCATPFVFPETTDRYFKAVNVSANAVPQVLVTEVRALLDRLPTRWQRRRDRIRPGTEPRLVRGRLPAHRPGHGTAGGGLHQRLGRGRGLHPPRVHAVPSLVPGWASTSPARWPSRWDTAGTTRRTSASRCCCERSTRSTAGLPLESATDGGSGAAGNAPRRVRDLDAAPVQPHRAAAGRRWTC